MTWAVDQISDGKRIFLEESKGMAEHKASWWPEPTRVYENVDGDKEYSKWLKEVSNGKE